MSLGIKLKQLRKSHGKTQQEIADAIGVAKSTYSLYESDRREPNVLTIKKLIKTLNTTGDYLLDINDINIEDPPNIIKLLNSLNEEGQEKVIGYAEDLVASGKYKKHNPNRMAEKEA